MFRFKGLPAAPFARYAALSDSELAAMGARRVVADARPGFPCRVSLEDAERGERLILVNFEHQPACSPYRACGPIFVREAAATTFDGTDVPPVLRPRLLSLRAYDRAGLMVDADVIEGASVETLLDRLFANEETDEIHVHYARRGCFACSVVRA
ncbi:MAG TPA: DUF1203 domain-containing protein [Rhizomicrobium sp.]|nr:DUF1203 domain-containing protein [Rhizomicrobium sp.]